MLKEILKTMAIILFDNLYIKLVNRDLPIPLFRKVVLISQLNQIEFRTNGFQLPFPNKSVRLDSCFSFAQKISSAWGLGLTVSTQCHATSQWASRFPLYVTQPLTGPHSVISIPRNLPTVLLPLDDVTQPPNVPTSPDEGDLLLVPVLGETVHHLIQLYYITELVTGR